jgi:DNA-binding FadR family transcriptional regulator
MAFHVLIADVAHCTKLADELRRLNIFYLKTALCEAVAATWSPDVASPVPHQEVAKAICVGDASSAEKLMRRHLENSSDMRGFVVWYRARGHAANKTGMEP